MSRDRIISALGDCARADEMFRPRGAGDTDTVKEYLANNLMAVLSFFLTKLNNDNSSAETKLNILLSLAELCRFLGPAHLSPVKHSLLACLKNAPALCRRSPALHAVYVGLWEAFVKNMDLGSLEVILPQVANEK